MARRTATTILAVAAALAVTSCGASERAVIDVYAASSLTEAFTTLEADYESTHPGIDIRLNLAGSNTLQRQILDGADADVFAPADPELFAALADEAAALPVPYASNTLALIVPADEVNGGNPSPVIEPRDLESDGILLARCAPGVPCGDATDVFLIRGGIKVARSTDEPNVRSVLTKVARGEVDAGFVYATDALSNPDVIEIPLDDPPIVFYSLLILSPDPNAEAFARFVASDQARPIFDELGFGQP